MSEGKLYIHKYLGEASAGQMRQGVMSVCLLCFNGPTGGLEGLRSGVVIGSWDVDPHLNWENHGRRGESVNLSPPFVNSMKVPLKKACAPSCSAVSSTQLWFY